MGKNFEIISMITIHATNYDVTWNVNVSTFNKRNKKRAIYLEVCIP